MFLQCWWNGTVRSLLISKDLTSCLINIVSGAILVKHVGDKHLKNAEVGMFYNCWVQTKLFGDRGYFWVELPYCHAVLSPSPWNADMTSQPVKARKDSMPMEFSGLTLPPYHELAITSPWGELSLNKSSPKQFQACTLKHHKSTDGNFKLTTTSSPDA